jgi:Domain of unknown function (DUF4287)
MAMAKSKAIYGIHPSVAMVQKWLAEIRKETGHSMEEWLALVKKEGPKDEKSRRNWLKSKPKLGTNKASWIAERAEGKGWEDTPEAYLKAADRLPRQLHHHLQTPAKRELANRSARLDRYPATGDISPAVSAFTMQRSGGLCRTPLAQIF